MHIPNPQKIKKTKENNLCIKYSNTKEIKIYVWIKYNKINMNDWEETLVILLDET